MVKKHIIGAVNKELEAKGFIRNKENPDFLIAIGGKKVRKREASFYDRRGHVRDVRVYEEGTYALDILDADSEEMIWRGTVQRQSDDDPLFSNAEKTERANL